EGGAAAPGEHHHYAAAYQRCAVQGNVGPVAMIDIDDNDGTTPDDDALAAVWAAMAEEKPDDDDIAAQWEKMAEQEEDELLSSVQAGRVLDQDEIDSLLGFDGEDEESARTGIHAIINSSLVSYERLPMLDVIFDRLVRMMTTSLRNFTSDNIEVSLDNISSVRFGDYLNSVPLPAMKIGRAHV